MSKKEKIDLSIPPFLKMTAEERKLAWQTETEFLRRMTAQGKPEPQAKKIELSPDPEPAPKPRADIRGEPPMATKTKTAKPKAKKAKGNGNPTVLDARGHKPGSNIARLHEAFDEKGEDAARKLGEKLGLASATIGIQFSHYRKAAGTSKTAKAAKPKARKAKAKAEAQDEAVV